MHLFVSCMLVNSRSWKHFAIFIATRRLSRLHTTKNVHTNVTKLSFTSRGGRLPMRSQIGQCTVETTCGLS